ncbi:retrotransposon protein, putative, ty1-copia subclass [Tanacetum coccineum]
MAQCSISLASPTDSEYLRSGMRYMIHNEVACLMLGSKGKDKKVYIPKPKNPKPTAMERPTKDDACHHCKEVGHCKRNCPAYLAELIKKKKQVGTASSSVVFIIELFSFPTKSWVVITNYAEKVGLVGNQKVMACGRGIQFARYCYHLKTHRLDHSTTSPMHTTASFNTIDSLWHLLFAGINDSR